MTFHLLLSNAFALFLVPLVLFLLFAAIRVLAGKDLPPSKVRITVVLAASGIAVTVLAGSVRLPSEALPYVREIQGILLLLCWANLSAYLLADLFLHYRRKGNVPSFLRELVLLGVYLFFAGTALRVIFDIGMSSILTATTVLTAALAFAMQNTLANIVSGFHIQADRNFQRGAWISLRDKDVTGEVVNVGIRYATLRTTEGHLVHIPNHHLSQNVVHAIAGSGEGPPGINLKVQLEYGFPPERAKEVLLRTLVDDPEILRQPPPSVRIDAFQDSGIQYNLRFHLEDYGTILQVRDGILKRVWYAVRREGQTFPYPHREIVSKAPVPPFRMDDEGTLAALRRVGIFSALGEEDLASLARNVRYRVYGAGETVLRQGEEGDSLFVVLSGLLDVSVDGVGVGPVSPGEFLGEMSLLTGERRRATVTAAVEAHLIEVSKEALGPIIRSHPAVTDGLTDALEHRLRKIMSAQQVRKVAGEGPTLHEAILRKLKDFFGIP